MLWQQYVQKKSLYLCKIRSFYSVTDQEIEFDGNHETLASLLLVEENMYSCYYNDSLLNFNIALLKIRKQRLAISDIANINKPRHTVLRLSDLLIHSNFVGHTLSSNVSIVMILICFLFRH